MAFDSKSKIHTKLKEIAKADALSKMKQVEADIAELKQIQSEIESANNLNQAKDAIKKFVVHIIKKNVREKNEKK